MEEYCLNRIKEGYGYCKRVNRKVPPAFCLVRKGDCQDWCRESITEWRKTHCPPLTRKQKEDKRLVSVVMPAKECEELYIQKTIDSLCENAVGPVQTIVVCDGWYKTFEANCVIKVDDVGQRTAANIGASRATGEFIFRLDPHCALSKGWDARMKSSCVENTLVAPVLDHLDPETWQGTGRDTAFWWLDGNLRCRSVRPWIPVQERKIEEDAMAVSGGAWMIRKDDYEKLGGHDEWLGRHGAVGPEWSLKVWLTGGRVLIRTDVVCSHLFRGKSPYGYNYMERESAYKKLYRMWVVGEDPRRKRPMEWLLYKFNNYTKHRPLVSVTMR